MSVMIGDDGCSKSIRSNCDGSCGSGGMAAARVRAQAALLKLNK